MNLQLLNQLCNIHAPSGQEGAMTDFLLQYIEQEQHKWAVRPQVFSGDEFQDTIVLVFGTPRTALFAHTDSIGYTVKYGKELVKIGGPAAKTGAVVRGTDSQGEIVCEIVVEENGKIFHDAEREIDRATTLTYACDFRTSEQSIQTAYLDNRLGCWIALQVAETLQDGIICFSTYEEHQGGSVPFLARFIYERYAVRQALIADVTWVTKGVRSGKGPAISTRDRLIPRRKYLDRIIGLAADSGLAFQIEVEDAGGSDGHELQRSPYPFDWCFVGPPIFNIHTPDEKVAKTDVSDTISLMKLLMKNL